MFFVTKSIFESGGGERDEGDDTLYSCLALETPFVFYVKRNLDYATHTSS